MSPPFLRILLARVLDLAEAEEVVDALAAVAAAVVVVEEQPTVTSVSLEEELEVVMAVVVVDSVALLLRRMAEALVAPHLLLLTVELHLMADMAAEAMATHPEVVDSPGGKSLVDALCFPIVISISALH